ncbi:uncharacterized protein LOC123307135 [Coccinella septempunctata]|uniref:uncharacterized protein LOC123307135 n=1 Tax=Coccinella septempunctata TaxID=41139 RepID=UPI001D09186F|nr:uncharacterized protein LOC123307135 [Coccinella septempunctata]
MDKLRFDFTVKPTADGKSNIICVTSIATTDGEVFELPDEYQPVNLHQQLINTPNYVKVKKSLTKRYQKSRIWIKLTEDISKTYLDEEKNVQFDDIYLEEIKAETNTDKSIPTGSEKILENFVEKLINYKPTQFQSQNLGQVANDFMIEKFTGRNLNANQWIENFNKECERFQVNEDKKKIEILKHFLQFSGAEWYSCMMIKYSIEAEWNIWERNFCDTFANKGWSPARHALAFKYQAGSLLEYALKKEKLLLEVRKSIDTGTLIDLIAFGLPNYVADKIDREILRETEDLYNEIGKLEHLVAKNNSNKYDKRKTMNPEEKPKRNDEKKPCQICISKEKGKRYHPEKNCWFKKENHGGVLKTVNNTALEIELNEKNPKN